jgi:site-specific recombinase XerD
MIELEHRDGSNIPIPYDVDTNEVNKHLMDYLLYRKKYAKFIHHTLRNIGPATINHEAQRIMYLINILSYQKYVDQNVTKVGIHYCSARYENNMVPIVDGMRNAEWAEVSIEQYVRSWRNFYRYLTVAGIEHVMYMPDTIETTVRRDQDDNFLSHTSLNFNYYGEKETAVDDSKKHFKDTYEDSIISMADFWRLYASLHAQDEVYAVMAYVEFATLLRVEALVRDFPLVPTLLNPDFKQYAVMKLSEKLIQDLHYTAKGGAKRQTRLSLSVQKIFNDEYIKSDICNYEKRFKKYKDNYCKTKWAKNKHRKPNLRYCWLNKKGTPVCVRQYQKAFENAARELGIKVHTHMMRHSGATQLLWRYLKEHNLTASHTNQLIVADAHAVLQKLLGHMDLSTTKMYVKTIERMIQEEKLSLLLNVALSTSHKHHEDLVKNNKALSGGLSSMERAVKHFEEYMTGSGILAKIEREVA